MEKIISDSEIKLLLGISGTTNDALVNVANRTATEKLMSIFGVDSFVEQTITDERVHISNPEILYLTKFPIDTSSISLKDAIIEQAITNVTFDQDPGALRAVRVKDASGLPTYLMEKEVLATYTAGYTVKDTLEVTNYATLPTFTIIAEVAGVETVWTFVASAPTGSQIVAATSNEVTAANIATALGGTVVGGLVTLPLGTRITLGTADASKLLLTSATIPELLKHAVALIVGEIFSSKEQKGGVASYTLNNKTVNFKTRTKEEGDHLQLILDTWIPKFQNIEILSI